ncbi:hypothetical protein ACMV5L_06290 [Serratia plymuthica]|uniref:hypothetical protein n=1 Tax=Serratia plymuthica TaxID=82996 RepID=UPI003DA24C2C
MSEHFDQLIEQAYRQYRGPAYLRSPAVSCIKVGIRLWCQAQRPPTHGLVDRVAR